MPMLIKRMFIEEMNAEFSAQAEDAEETPTIGTVTDDLSGLGLVAHQL